MKPLTIVREQTGFTLVESMIAMFFVSFMVAEMGMVMTYASRTTNLSQRITRANALADEAIEKSRNTAFENIQFPIAALGEACTMSGTTATCTSSLDGGRFARVRIVTPRDSSFPPGATTLEDSEKVDVDITVSYTDARGAAQVIRVASIISRH
jgi:type II secretory pathway pseudopilin PulG